jgi:hypothetical protein
VGSFTAPEWTHSCQSSGLTDVPSFATHPPRHAVLGERVGTKRWLGGMFPKHLSIRLDIEQLSEPTLPAHSSGKWRCFCTSYEYILNCLNYQLGALKLGIMPYLMNPDLTILT